LKTSKPNIWEIAEEYWNVNSPCESHDTNTVFRGKGVTEEILALIYQTYHANIVRACEKLVHIVFGDAGLAQVGVLNYTVHYGCAYAGDVDDRTPLGGNCSSCSLAAVSTESCKLSANGEMWQWSIWRSSWELTESTSCMNTLLPGVHWKPALPPKSGHRTKDSPRAAHLKY